VLIGTGNVTLQRMIFVCLLDMQPIWIKNSFWDVNKKKWHERCKFVSHFLYNNGLPVLTMDTKYPNQVFLMFVWTIYRPFLLNSGWKLNYVQIMIYVHVCSTWSIVKLKIPYETWITRNAVNGVSLVHLYNLITHIAYLCSQSIPNVQINYFIFDWSNNILLVLNRGWKHYSLEMVILVNVSSTFSVVLLTTRFESWITWNDVNGVSLIRIAVNAPVNIEITELMTEIKKGCETYARPFETRLP
jgi:hypothetical protein